MRDIIMQGPGPAAPAAPARPATPAELENAQLDARLELAAKRAALRSMEAQGEAADVGELAAVAPQPPGGRVNTIMIERDGKTIVLENPTPAQLRQVGMGTSTPQLEPGMIAVLTGATLVAIVTIVWMVLHYWKRGRSSSDGVGNTEMASRMARIENAIESVAVEVERISEGQRFTSRLLAEGAAVPVHAGVHGEGECVRRNGEG
ncbi:MAG TPA: hypothetical protein VE861_02435 [Gemmatimonadaceae bacterium]|nr:hypothetical protein [Gemmatimonadaceae bacterium]